MRLAYSTMCVRIAHLLNDERCVIRGCFEQVHVCKTLLFSIGLDDIPLAKLLLGYSLR